MVFIRSAEPYAALAVDNVPPMLPAVQLATIAVATCPANLANDLATPADSWLRGS